MCDLADGHVAALQKIERTPDLGCQVYNLGTGKGTSVLEIVAAFEKACGKELPKKMCERRPGDAAEIYASTAKVRSTVAHEGSPLSYHVLSA